jgi:predicted aldo/keto reductase-like oxidoreductase
MSDEKKGLTRRDLFAYGSAAAGGAALISAVSPREALAKDMVPQVPRRVLGKTKQSIPILLMGGSMRFDQRFDPKLAECMRFGVNYFDVADCYAGGTSESAVGAFLDRTKARDKVWITTKSDAWDPKGFEETLATSLQRMKTSSVDMYFLHGLDDEDVFTSELAKTVEGMKKAGKIKFFGFSCHHGNVVALLNKASKLSWVDSIMFRYNFRQYGNKELNSAIDACAKAGIGLIAMKTQGSEAGFADAWKKFEKTGKWNKHQAVLKAVWADERITAAVSHMDTFEKLKENIAAALDKSELGAVDREALQKYADATRGYACDGCDHLCNPAVSAPVQIGATLRYLMYHDVYGEAEKAKEMFEKLPERAKRLSVVDFTPANAACPHGIDVASHMKRAAEIFHA